MKTIEIPYEPRAWTEELHESDKRWKVIVAHRRSGKTIASLNHLQRDALTIPKSRWAYISPTYKQSKNIAWDALKEYARAIPGVKFNEAELRCDYPNGSRITLYGADNPDALRGIGLWGVIFDEYSQQPSNIFSEIIRPALADHNGYAIWIGTPKGKNDFWRLYDLAQREKGWLAIHLTVDDTKILSKAELEDARKVMDEDEYDQEFYCSFEASIKGAYYAEQLRKARDENRIGNIPHDPAMRVKTWWDLGMGDAMVILFFQHIGKEWRLIDSYSNVGAGFEHYAQVLSERAKDEGYIYDGHYAPHDINVRELGTGESRIEVARKLGINFQIVPKLGVDEGINAVRRRFKELWIDEKKNELLLDALALYHKQWDDARGMFKLKPLHDWTSDFADALRYWAVSVVEKEGSQVAQYKPKWKGHYGKKRR